MSLASTDWLLAHGWRQGLFLHCVDEMAERPLPFGLEDKVGCYRVRDECTKKKAFSNSAILFCKRLVSSIWQITFSLQRLSVSWH